MTLLTIGVGLVIVATTSLTTHGEPPARPGPSDGSAPPPGVFTPEQMVGTLGQQLVAGLKATPGCHGAEAIAAPGGKLAIFGWFQDKKAALAWHSSELHTQISKRFAAGRTMDRPAMEHVPDDVPLMVIASITMGAPTDGGGPTMHFGIEVYRPLPGGFSFQGGAFSPRAFQDLMQVQRERARDAE
ncbi:MAG: hypothetical protein AAFX05_01280 [Planctomycetota bacterium]